jgi:Zn finger protein HypA/HybF involved in hydrogenase expression
MELEGGKVQVICEKCGCVFQITAGVNPVYDKCPKCGSTDFTVGNPD